ncbi:Ger(x)C family spore germination protein [Bacillus sp. JJ1562]|uniref:Ger(x)C family spore germination protein n=1 Tax=Bacillus sp. JJ1562 TaxID=3122960 RepID=UPI00300128BB
MDKWRNAIVFILLFTCLVTLIGCTRTRIVDRLSIIHVFGFDLNDRGDLIGTVLIPEYTKSKASNKIEYLQEEADVAALLTPRLATHTSTPVELAKTRVLVLGKGYAETGIRDVVDRVLANPKIGTNIQIVASTHSAEETLKALKKQGELTLAEEIIHNMRGQLIPYMNLHVFLNHFYGQGMDPYVPMITIDKFGKIQINNVGIFKDDKFMLHLNVEQTFLFSVLEDYRTQALFQIDLQEGDRRESLVVQGFRSRNKWDWVKSEERLNLTMNLIWTITHRPQRYNLENPEDLKALKKIIAKDVKKDVEDLIKTFQEKEVDPLGIGNIVRSQDKDWNEESFYELYPSIPVNINVNLEIIHSGLQG